MTEYVDYDAFDRAVSEYMLHHPARAYEMRLVTVRGDKPSPPAGIEDRPFMMTEAKTNDGGVVWLTTFLVERLPIPLEMIEKLRAWRDYQTLPGRSAYEDTPIGHDILWALAAMTDAPRGPDAQDEE